MGAAITMDRGDEAGVRAVRATLRGPVMKALQGIVPELACVPMADAYDRTMNSIYLLERCFRAFQRQRELFRHLLVDARGKVVGDGAGLLSCGRSLDQVVAMIVRSAARRYFRRHMGRPEVPRRQNSPFARARRLTAGAHPHVAGKSVHAAEELYDSIKAYLLHDWQVSMVPTYATLEPAQVLMLGAKLLECDSAAKLARALGLPTTHDTAPQSMLDEARARTAEASRASCRGVARLSIPPEMLAAGSVGTKARRSLRPSGRSKQGTGGESAAVPASECPRLSGSVLLTDIVTLDGGYLRAASFTDCLASASVRAALPAGGCGGDAADILGSIAGRAGGALVQGLGLDRDQLAVLLLAAHGTMGREPFERLFGGNANPRLIKKLVDHASQAGIGADSPLPAIAAFATRAFGRVRTAPRGPAVTPVAAEATD